MYKVEDLRLGDYIFLDDETQGEIICLVSEKYKDWENEDFDFLYMLKDGNVRQDIVENIIKLEKK